MVNLGGFFASLSLKTDDQSFQKGVGILEKFPTHLKTIAVGAVGVAAGMVTLAATTSTAVAKLDATATTLGMSARSLDNWKGAVGRAGGDADTFVDSLLQMNEAFRNLKIGEVREDFIKATGMSGGNFSSMMAMNNEQRLRTIWGALEKVADPDKQQALVEKIFGSGGVDLMSRLKNQGTNLGTLYAQASGQNPLTDKDYKAAIDADKKQREIAAQLAKDFENIGMKISEGLLPALDRFSKWLSEHQKDLDNFAKTVGDATAAIANSIGGLAGWINNGTKQDAAVKSIYGENAGSVGNIAGGIFSTKLLFGDANAKRLVDMVTAGKISASEAKTLDQSQYETARLNLFDAGLKDQAFASNEGVSKIIRKAEGTLNIKISTDGSVDAKTAEALKKALTTSYATSGTR